MCTAATYKTEDFYFGRTLDYEFSYGSEITVMPRKFPLRFRHSAPLDEHYAIIGMAHIEEGYPMFFDAVNEKGLAMAGLNFVGNAAYAEPVNGKENVAQFEFITWILSRCADIDDAKKALAGMNLTGTAFSDKLPAAQLHWIIADVSGAITVESMSDGIHVYDNPPGILTNNPPFEQQLFQLNNYAGLSAKQPENTFAPGYSLNEYSRGMGAMGLPGDLSSSSRFVRAAFTKLNSVSGTGEAESVSQFFHILGAVDQQRGCCEVEPGKYEITIYTSCCNATKGIYYYTSYENHRISAVDMHRTDLDSSQLFCYPMIEGEQIYFQN